MDTPGRVTELLRAWNRGSREALDELVPVVYTELRRLARRQLARARPDHTLEALDPRQGQVVELRYFGGLSVAETAEALQISPATVKRNWSVAKLWLRRELARAGPA
jgi:RNA polymerase sigma factor (sigma-70 family)